MRPARILLRTALGCALMATLAGCAELKAASQPEVWVEVSPGTVNAGSPVAIRANCIDNTQPATVTSKAFGSVKLRPANRYLQAEVRVPPSTGAGRYEVSLTCASGERAVTTLTVANPRTKTTPPPPRGTPTVGPHTGGGYLSRDAAAR